MARERIARNEAKGRHSKDILCETSVSLCLCASVVPELPIELGSSPGIFGALATKPGEICGLILVGGRDVALAFQVDEDLTAGLGRRHR
jgi:hypothetical protein